MKILNPTGHDINIINKGIIHTFPSGHIIETEDENIIGLALHDTALIETEKNVSSKIKTKSTPALKERRSKTKCKKHPHNKSMEDCDCDFQDDEPPREEGLKPWMPGYKKNTNI